MNNDKLNQIEKLEYELKVIWTRIQSSPSEVKTVLLAEYRKKHESLKKTMVLIGLR